MNSHPAKRILPAALFVLLALAGPTIVQAADGKKQADPAAVPNPPPAIDPATGLPLIQAGEGKKRAGRSAAPSSSWRVDPATGLPLGTKDSDWPDPDKTLPEVIYDGVPLGEVARMLRQEFKDAFDILIPNAWQDPNNTVVSIDPSAITIKMQLKNVRASEVFNAMNLIFEAENTPCRWELKLNGSRPMAMLRMLPQLLPPALPQPPPRASVRLVYFVGDLLADGKRGGMTMEQLVETVSEVYQMSYGPAKGVLQFHKGAQLLIITGSPDQIQFVQQTLSALREKASTQQRGFPGLLEPRPVQPVPGPQ